MRREPVGPGVGEEPEARALDVWPKRLRRVDRSELQVRPRRENLRDDSIVLLLFEAARRVEEIPARREQIGGGGDGFPLRPGELRDPGGTQPVADLRDLAQSSGPAARRI
ncbi:MAG: hypothetical protein M3547_14955, partial [Acidobacteriota bacterium]|nr:hypothetical protein [Acidobacteriota bacterium]